MAKGYFNLPRAVIGLIAGGLTLVVFNLAMNPVPVAAGPAFIGGVLGFLWLRGSPAPAVFMLATAGAGVGVAAHRNMHLSGSSPPPPEGLLTHLAMEGFSGYLAALAALLAMGLTMRLLERR